MNNFSIEIKDFFIITFTTLILFFIHQFLFSEIFENEKTTLISEEINYVSLSGQISFGKTQKSSAGAERSNFI